MSIEENLENVRGRVRDAVRRSGRPPESVRVLAVSKTHPPVAVREAVEAGQLAFGESRVQELVAKAAAPEIPSGVEWHFVGHLQKNKVRKLFPHCLVLHSIDSLELAHQVDRIAGEEGVFPEVYLEVNVAGDTSKFGFSPESVRRDLEALLSLERVAVTGLMTLPPAVRDPAEARPYFAALRELRDRLVAEAGVPLPGLSMGMSGDFEVAVEEGSTIVRVGSTIFGAR